MGSSDARTHTRRRGKDHRCNWCGQIIKIGETYETWFWFDDGMRSSVFAHTECSETWKDAASDGDDCYADGENERPEKKGK